jgi:hypothetical protein
MMRREVPAMPMRSMRPQLAALVLAACVCAPISQFGAAAARPARKIPKFEVKLNGPASVRPRDSLEMQRFTAVLTNRSAEPQVLAVRNGYLLNARWDWFVTDSKGSPVGMEFILRGYCGTPMISLEAQMEARKLRDSDLVTLAPGESHEFPVQPGPLDDYYFPAAGTYHLAVTLIYVPPNTTYYFDAAGKRQKAIGLEQWDFSRLGVDALAAVQNSLPVYATSDNWNLVLAAPRHARQ